MTKCWAKLEIYKFYVRLSKKQYKTHKARLEKSITWITSPYIFCIKVWQMQPIWDRKWNYKWKYNRRYKTTK